MCLMYSIYRYNRMPALIPIFASIIDNNPFALNMVIDTLQFLIRDKQDLSELCLNILRHLDIKSKDFA